ncbi:TraB/GumN family protein [Phenylobacterium sp. J367]|nr:TraB/GumN family protein [Phenylobacterium sp. J367]MCR5878018.1 TraB/GumN family protein [Phenylobacterium sp. J367]
MRRIAALLIAVAGLAAGCARAEPPVWTVTDRDSEMVIFGSVHVLPPGLDWRSAALDRAVKRADDIWFELPMTPGVADESARLALRAGLLPQGQALSKLLTPEDAQRLARVAMAYDVDPAMLEAFRPWMAEQALAGAAYRRAQASDAHGVEETLAAAARPETQRRAFETPAEQIGFFANVPLNEQIASPEPDGPGDGDRPRRVRPSRSGVDGRRPRRHRPAGDRAAEDVRAHALPPAGRREERPLGRHARRPPEGRGPHRGRGRPRSPGGPGRRAGPAAGAWLFREGALSPRSRTSGGADELRDPDRRDEGWGDARPAEPA